jgi:hypothetical protein
MAFTLERYYHFPGPFTAAIYMKMSKPDFYGTRELTVFINDPAVFRIMHILVGTTFGEFKAYFWAKFDTMPEPLGLRESIHMYDSFSTAYMTHRNKDVYTTVCDTDPKDIEPRSIQIFFQGRLVADHETPKLLNMRKYEQIFVQKTGRKKNRPYTKSLIYRPRTEIVDFSRNADPSKWPREKIVDFSRKADPSNWPRVDFFDWPSFFGPIHTRPTNTHSQHTRDPHADIHKCAHTDIHTHTRGHTHTRPAPHAPAPHTRPAGSLPPGTRPFHH